MLPHFLLQGVGKPFLGSGAEGRCSCPALVDQSLQGIWAWASQVAADGPSAIWKRSGAEDAGSSGLSTALNLGKALTLLLTITVIQSAGQSPTVPSFG